MAMVWLARRTLRVVGYLCFVVQRFLGGTPETADAAYYGPGVGKTPETADLRKFKPSASGERWVVLKRDEGTVVFKASLKRTPRLISALKGFDKVHLCRHDLCSEDGTHFKVYGLVQKLDPEKFHLQQAGEEARSLGSWLWSSALGGTRRVVSKVKDYASESEPDEEPCQAHKVAWSTESGDERLAKSVCCGKARDRAQLLREDQLGEPETIPLCDLHASQYIIKRWSKKCGRQGCRRVGLCTTGGVFLRWDHEHELLRRRSRSRSVDRSGDGEPNVVADDEEPAVGHRRRSRSWRPGFNPDPIPAPAETGGQVVEDPMREARDLLGFRV